MPAISTRQFTRSHKVYTGGSGLAHQDRFTSLQILQHERPVEIHSVEPPEGINMGYFELTRFFQVQLGRSGIVRTRESKIKEAGLIIVQAGRALL